LSAGDLPQTPLEELFAAFPQTPSWILRGILLREGRRGDPLFSRYTPCLP